MFARKLHTDANRKSHKDAYSRLTKGARSEALTASELSDTDTPGTNGKAARIAFTELNNKSTQGREKLLEVESNMNKEKVRYYYFLEACDTFGILDNIKDWDSYLDEAEVECCPACFRRIFATVICFNTP